MRIVFAVASPLPYHTSLLNKLSELVDLHVLYLSRTDQLVGFNDIWGDNPQFNFSFHWSKAVMIRPLDLRLEFSLGIWRKLKRLRPDVVLVWSWGPLSWEALAWGRISRIPVVMWSESTRWSGLARGSLSNSFRRFLVSQSTAYVTSGSKATEYLIELGAHPGKIVTSCLPSSLADQALSRHLAANSIAGPKDGPRYLFVGRLISLKCLPTLLEAFNQVVDELPTATLTIVGDGPMFESVSLKAARFGNSVRLLGRLEGEALDEAYGSADILVLPSVREVWGLVVNEALSHGLYVIGSDQVGSMYDLVGRDSPSVGVIVRAEDVQGLTRAMIDAGRHAPLGVQARVMRAERMRACTSQAFAQSIHRAAELALRDFHFR